MSLLHINISQFTVQSLTESKFIPKYKCILCYWICNVWYKFKKKNTTNNRHIDVRRPTPSPSEFSQLSKTYLDYVAKATPEYFCNY